MTIISNVYGVSDRAYNNALKAKLRDPNRSIRLLDFLTRKEKIILYHDVFGIEGYEDYIERCDALQWREFNNV